MLKTSQIAVISIALIIILHEVIKCSAFIKFEFFDNKNEEKKDKKGKKEDGDDHSDSPWEKWRSSWEKKGMEQEEKRLKEGVQKIRYLLRDRKGQSWGEVKRNGTLPENIWQEDAFVKILIHGYSNHHHQEPAKILREQNILDIGIMYGRENKSLNIIAVDWTVLAVEPQYRYEFAVSAVPTVGKDLAQLVLKLCKDGKIKNVKNIHLIGFNLGAHVAAVAAKDIQEATDNVTVGRITGLDPVGPGFEENNGRKWKNESIVLEKTKADFVDIIHCNMGNNKDFSEAITKGRYGSSIQAGHVDFYPNGGETQDGCQHADESLEKACSSRRCPTYYANSIAKKYIACPCDDWDYFKGGKCNCTLENGGGRLMGSPATRESDSERVYLQIKESE